MDQKQVIKEYFDAVDEKLQKLILSPITKNKIERIVQKYPLSDEQALQLENEIDMVLLGMEMISNFRSNIANEMGITYDQALKLASAVNEEIFSGVIEELKEIEFINTEVREGRMIAEDEGETEVSVDEIPEQPTVDKAVLEKNEFLEKQTWSYPSTSTPDHMIPDHNMMEKTDGPHLHSQNIMPQIQPGTGTIIDRKLSGIFRNRATEESIRPSQEVTSRRNEKYKGGDPYREPIE